MVNAPFIMPAGCMPDTAYLGESAHHPSMPLTNYGPPYRNFTGDNVCKPHFHTMAQYPLPSPPPIHHTLSNSTISFHTTTAALYDKTLRNDVFFTPPPADEASEWLQHQPSEMVCLDPQTPPAHPAQTHFHLQQLSQPQPQYEQATLPSPCDSLEIFNSGFEDWSEVADEKRELVGLGITLSSTSSLEDLNVVDPSMLGYHSVQPESRRAYSTPDASMAAMDSPFFSPAVKRRRMSDQWESTFDLGLGSESESDTETENEREVEVAASRTIAEPETIAFEGEVEIDSSDSELEEVTTGKRKRGRRGFKAVPKAKKELACFSSDEEDEEEAQSSYDSMSGLELAPPRPTRSPTLFQELTKAKLDWCRYCGTTEGVNWRPGPWGKRTLCNKHGCDYKGYGFVCKLPRLDLTQFARESIHDRDRPVLQLFCCGCQRRESWKENVLVRCEGCPKAYHQNCFAGRIEDQEVEREGPWFCSPECRENLEKKRIVVELPRRRLPLMSNPKTASDQSRRRSLRTGN
ncbi:uncharacterized protein VTP21DRAFT_6542 [Calcarisporiella thermophila]|uniref:uncharacterized protein n=1 Tax=Calcarisporiella thermophila TaxID=911321 RepID=UPI003743A914